MDELRRDGGKEHGCSAAVAFALLEKEASTRDPFFRKMASHGSRYRRLASTGHTLQPKDTSPVWISDPLVDIGEEVDSGTIMAFGIAFVCLRVEGSAFRDRKP